MQYLLIIINIFLLVIGQTLWKIGVQKATFDSLNKIINIIISPWIISGLFLYVIATALWIYLLSKLPLSYLYPMQSLAYVLAIFIGLFVFHEHISIIRWFGLVFILIGVYFVTK